MEETPAAIGTWPDWRVSNSEYGVIMPGCHGPRQVDFPPATEKKEPASSDSAAAWAALAPELAVWTWANLVNRTDVWGAYWPAHRRDRGNSWTAPAKKDRGRVLLTQEVLERHFLGKAVEHVVGLHSTSPDNTSRWAALDIDAHDGGTADPAANLAAALAWYEVLDELGFAPLLADSNGRGGYHLWALFAEPVPTPKVYALLRWLIRDHKAYGLTASTETFPKQPAIKAGGYGNWLRLPGRHHTREHQSRVWGGKDWLEGGAAVRHVLGLRGSRPRTLPALPPPVTRLSQPPRPMTGDGLGTRVAGYIARLPHLSAGQGRDNVAYRAACRLVRDLRLPDEIALQWLLRWDAGNTPPKGEARLREVIASAHAYGRQPYGSASPAPSRGRHGVTVLRFSVEVR